MGLDYEGDKAKIVDPVKSNAGLPMEIWHSREGIKTYPTMAAFLKAVATYNAEGSKLNATYVYDAETGLKLFGRTAFYVKSGNGEFSTFLRKREAEAFAKKVRRHRGDVRSGLGLVLLLMSVLRTRGSKRGSGFVPEAIMRPDAGICR